MQPKDFVTSLYRPTKCCAPVYNFLFRYYQNNVGVYPVYWSSYMYIEIIRIWLVCKIVSTRVYCVRVIMQCIGADAMGHGWARAHPLFINGGH